MGYIKVKIDCNNEYLIKVVEKLLKEIKTQDISKAWVSQYNEGARYSYKPPLTQGFLLEYTIVSDKEYLRYFKYMCDIEMRLYEDNKDLLKVMDELIKKYNDIVESNINEDK